MSVRGEVIVHADAEALARAAAESFVERAREAVARSGRFSVALTGGSSPVRLYRLLGEEEFAARIPWRSVHLFWGDERVVPPGHPRSNFGMANSLLVARVPLPAENVHRIRGELGAEQARDAYEAELRRHFGDVPRFDLVHLGLGPDGHVASLFPFQRSTLDERERWVATSLLAELGERRVTLTLPALNGAARVEFLIPDPDKAAIAASAMAGSPDPFRIPAQLVWPSQGELAWHLTGAVADRIRERDLRAAAAFARRS